MYLIHIGFCALLSIGVATAYAQTQLVVNRDLPRANLTDAASANRSIVVWVVSLGKTVLPWRPLCSPHLAGRRIALNMEALGEYRYFVPTPWLRSPALLANVAFTAEFTSTTPKPLADRTIFNSQFNKPRNAMYLFAEAKPQREPDPAPTSHGWNSPL